MFDQRQIATIILLFVMMSVTNYCYAQQSTKKYFYVSNKGLNTNSGTSASDPFASIERARDAVKTFVASSGSTQVTEVIVYLMDTLVLSSPLNFDGTHSGRSNLKVLYTNYPNTNPVISGGIGIPGSLWQKVPGKSFWMADVTSLVQEDLRQLYVDGMPAVRAREPINEVNVFATASDEVTIPKLLTSPENPSQTELVVSCKWIAERQKVTSFSKGSNTSTIKVRSDFGAAVFDSLVGNVYWLENDYNFLDERGEFYFRIDNANGIQRKLLYYYPLAGKDNISASTIIVPRLEKLIDATNLEYVSFENITFCDVTWLASNTTGYYTKQASFHYLQPGDWGNLIPAAINLNTSSNVRINNCTIRNFGGDGLAFTGNCKNIWIEGNKIYNGASSAIRAGNHPLPTQEAELENSIIKSNTIYDVAQEYFSSPGIFLIFPRGVEVSGNTIYNLPWAGISIGNCWDKSITIMGGNSIRFNRIYNVLTKLSDSGAIYSLGYHSPSSSISDNDIDQIPRHDLLPAVRAAIYLDEGSGNLIVKNNAGSSIAKYENTENADIFRHIHTNFNDNQVEKNDFQTNSIWVHAYNKHASDAPDQLKAYFKPAIPMAADIGDLGVRFVDVNHDGLKDMIVYRWRPVDSQYRAYINTGSDWIRDDRFAPPYHTMADGIGDMGVLFVDFDKDGYEDFIYRRKGWPEQQGAYRNTGCGWQFVASYTPPIDLFDDGYGELGVRAVDVNNDGFKDLVRFRWINSSEAERSVHLNDPVAKKWVESTNPAYLLPFHINSQTHKDLGLRFLDLNGDGFDDLVYNRGNYDQKGAYYSTRSGWQHAVSYTPPIQTANDIDGDLGVRFVDVNADGRKDIISVNSNVNRVFLNTNGTWVEDLSGRFLPPSVMTAPSSKDVGVRLADVNGDGREDLLKGFWYNENSADMTVYFNDSWGDHFTPYTPCVTAGAVANDTYVVDKLLAPEEEVILYPNPADRLVDIRSIEAPALITIVNANGQVLQTIVDGAKQIDVSEFAKGFYILELRFKNRTEKHKLFIE